MAYGDEAIRFEAVAPTDCCGWYIEDTWTGKTVCDLYFLSEGKVVNHDGAETHAGIIAEALNDRVEL